MSMTASAAAIAPEPAWLRDRHFDLALICGVALLALLSGVVVIAKPSLFPLVLIFDLWILGYHHVIATFTRLCYNKESVREYRFFLFGLPLIVLAGVIALAAGVGLWTLTTVYFYWQWFHYTRQSWGVTRAYQRKEGGGAQVSRVDTYVFYALPLAGILYRSYQSPETFLGVEFVSLPMAGAPVAIAIVGAAAAFAYWCFERYRLWRAGAFPVASSMYMLTHFIIFAVGYLFIENVTYGWLVINVWHNAQYLLFVRMFNERKFKDGVDDGAKALSWLSQRSRLIAYFATTLAISTAIYATISATLAVVAVVPAVIVYMTINFHHYVVDGYIWKKKAFKAVKAA